MEHPPINGTEWLDNAIISILNSLKSGGSTRHICNLIFEVETATLIVRPGKEKMDWVYSRLASMRKKNIVKCAYPGHWELANK